MSGIELNFKSLVRQEVLAELSEDGCKIIIDLCMSLGLIADRYECPKCGKSMVLKKRMDSTDGYEWTCRVFGSSSHYVKRSVRLGSWFSESKLPMITVLQMTECFVSERSMQDCMNLLKVSNKTLCDWRNFFREVCLDICVKETGMIGGPGMIVEIDECKFGKRKFNRGKRVNGKWVFVGVERGSKNCFLRVVERNDKETLLNVIKTSILPGTTVYSDCFKSYDCLEDEFKHLLVNHSLHFNDPENGGHTNSIGTWSAIKRKLPPRSSTADFDKYLGEHIWRRYNSGSKDLMKTFVEAIKLVYPPKTKD